MARLIFYGEGMNFMDNVLKDVYKVILNRKKNPTPGSYTCYLFEKGVDKILKKCGEEASEVIIAAKNGNNLDTVNEICDLLYHLLVLMAQQGIELECVLKTLQERGKKVKNLKQFYNVDKNS